MSMVSPLFCLTLFPSVQFRNRFRFGFALALVFGGLTSISAADDQLRAVQRKYSETIQPLLQSACSDCHTGESADAGFDLDQYTTLEQILTARKKWQKVEHRLAAKEMPPEDAEPLTDSDHQAVMDWLNELLHSVDCTNINPGRVTLRRLNRTEYQNTVRDLLGIEYRAAAEFPGDDVGYGFDNIADVISLPPILMEKYLAAAEEITAQALVDPDVPAFNKTIRFTDLEISTGASKENSNVVLFTNCTVGKEIKLPGSGKYKITVRASGTPGADGPPKMAIGFSKQKSVIKAVTATESKPLDIECLIRASSVNSRLEISFINDSYQPKGSGKKEFDCNLYIQQVNIQGPFEKYPDSNRAVLGLGTNSQKDVRVPSSQAEQKELVRKILNQFTSRAFRRRASSEELDQLVGLFESARADGDGFEVALRFPMQAVLVSPHFLYKVEAPVAAGQTRFLDEFELATSLSYFLWSTMPDEQLLQTAGEGKLRDANTLREQLKRMLADPKSKALNDNFVTQWLQLRHLEDFQPDPDQFPGVDRQLRDDMITETKLVVAELIKTDASITDLLTTDFTFVNQRLADFYGIQGVSGEQFRRVPTKKTGRLGLMTQGSVLTLTSNPTRTSPVKRGKWIMENLLGEEPPPPDPKAMKLEDQAELTGTVRQRLEQHRVDPNCAVCHKVMDELGFALENYDAVGRWRETDDGTVIDATGKLPDGSEFTGAWEMQQIIREKMRDKFVRCLTEKMLVYATGRGMEYFDDCAIDTIMESLKEKDYRFSELIYQVIISDPFLKRRGEAE